MNLGPFQRYTSERVLSAEEHAAQFPRPRRVSELPMRQMKLQHRLFAGGSDLVLYAICTFIWFVVIINWILGYNVVGASENAPSPPPMIAFTVFTIGWFLIAVLGEFLVLMWTAQSFGKKFVGLFAVDNKLGFSYMSKRQAVVRSLIKGLMLYASATLLFWSLNNDSAPFNLLQLAAVALNIIVVVLLLGLLHKDRRGVHDLIAKTKVIRP